MKFDRTNLKQIRSDIEDALRGVAAKHAISLSIGNLSFSDTKFTTRMVALTNEDPLGIDSPSRVKGMPDIGTKFVLRNRRFEVTGHQPTRPKYPIQAIDLETGRKFKLSVEMLKKEAIYVTA